MSCTNYKCGFSLVFSAGLSASRDDRKSGRAIDERDQGRAGSGREKERAGFLYQTSLGAHPFFRSSPLTESLEKASVAWFCILTNVASFPRTPDKAIGRKILN